MILAGTGHRPQRLRIGPLDGFHPSVQKRLGMLAMSALDRYDPSLVISGMALGWDQALAEAAVWCGTPFDAYIPFRGQELRWNREAQDRYNDLLAEARRIVVVSEGGYRAEKMHQRNVRMVIDADAVLALWDGSDDGGTYDCVTYAERVGKRVINLWPSWEKYAARNVASAG
jgi:uncharacterized phage-like protein YoqJ